MNQFQNNLSILLIKFKNVVFNIFMKKFSDLNEEIRNQDREYRLFLDAISRKCKMIRSLMIEYQLKNFNFNNFFFNNDIISSNLSCNINKFIHDSDISKNLYFVTEDLISKGFFREFISLVMWNYYETACFIVNFTKNHYTDFEKTYLLHQSIKGLFFRFCFHEINVFYINILVKYFIEEYNSSNDISNTLNSPFLNKMIQHLTECINFSEFVESILIRVHSEYCFGFNEASNRKQHTDLLSKLLLESVKENIIALPESYAFLIKEFLSVCKDDNDKIFTFNNLLFDKVIWRYFGYSELISQFNADVDIENNLSTIYKELEMSDSFIRQLIDTFVTNNTFKKIIPLNLYYNTVESSIPILLESDLFIGLIKIYKACVNKNIKLPNYMNSFITKLDVFPVEDIKSNYYFWYDLFPNLTIFPDIGERIPKHNPSLLYNILKYDIYFDDQDSTIQESLNKILNCRHKVLDKERVLKIKLFLANDKNECSISTILNEIESVNKIISLLESQLSCISLLHLSIMNICVSNFYYAPLYFLSNTLLQLIKKNQSSSSGQNKPSKSIAKSNSIQPLSSISQCLESVRIFLTAARDKITNTSSPTADKSNRLNIFRHIEKIFNQVSQK